MPSLHSPRDLSKSPTSAKKPVGLPVPPAKSSRYTVFLSYSALDSESAKRVADAIRKSGAHVIDWLVEPEKQEQAEIAARLRESQEVVALVTAHSAMNPWLHWEIGLVVGLGKRLTLIMDRENHHELPPPLRDAKAVCVDDMEKLRHSLGQRVCLRDRRAEHACLPQIRRRAPASVGLELLRSSSQSDYADIARFIAAMALSLNSSQMLLYHTKQSRASVNASCLLSLLEPLHENPKVTASRTASPPLPKNSYPPRPSFNSRIPRLPLIQLMRSHMRRAA